MDFYEFSMDIRGFPKDPSWHRGEGFRRICTVHQTLHGTTQVGASDFMVKNEEYIRFFGPGFFMFCHGFYWLMMG